MNVVPLEANPGIFICNSYHYKYKHGCYETFRDETNTNAI